MGWTIELNQKERQTWLHDFLSDEF